MNPGGGESEMNSQGVCGFLIEGSLFLFYCFSTVAVLSFESSFSSDLNMNHVIQIHPKLASRNCAEKLPWTHLHPPVFSLLFSSISCRLSPHRLAPWWLEAVRGCIFGNPFGQALCYSLISRLFFLESLETLVGCPDSLVLNWKKQLHKEIKTNKADSIFLNGQKLRDGRNGENGDFGGPLERK